MPIKKTIIFILFVWFYGTTVLFFTIIYTNFKDHHTLIPSLALGIFLTFITIKYFNKVINHFLAKLFSYVLLFLAIYFCFLANADFQKSHSFGSLASALYFSVLVMYSIPSSICLIVATHLKYPADEAGTKLPKEELETSICNFRK